MTTALAPQTIGADGTVDRERGIIFGVCVAQVGRARGHFYETQVAGTTIKLPVEADQQTLNGILSTASEYEHGVKVMDSHDPNSTVKDTAGFLTGFREDGAKLRADFAEVPVDDTAELLGLTAARVYGFDLDELRPIAGRIGPTPESLGQDPTLRSDPAERASARWWKAEYGVQPPG